MTPLEINRKIAELKGMKVCYSESHGHFSPQVFKGADFTIRNYQECGASDLPDWAENISDAWELFEESTEPYLKKMPPHYECVMRGENLNIVGQARAKTPTMAICLAWIKWKKGCSHYDESK